MPFTFHHIGIPTTVPQEGERYSERFRMYTSGGERPLRIQYHRFDEGSPLHKLIQTLPHVAFKVDDLQQAIVGEEVLLGPYTPIKNFHVAIVKRPGILLEFIETTLTEEEIWDVSKHQDSLLYSNGE